MWTSVKFGVEALDSEMLWISMMIAASELCTRICNGYFASAFNHEEIFNMKS